MDERGIHDSMYEAVRVTNGDETYPDTVSGTLWMGFKERYDAVRSVIPVLKRYGNALLHANFIGDWTASELPNIPPNTIDTLMPFFLHSVVALDDSNNIDRLVRNDSASNRLDTSNRTFVHISEWVDTLGGKSDTMLYITNMRTDDSWDTTGKPMTIDERFITMQFKRPHIVYDAPQN